MFRVCNETTKKQAFTKLDMSAYKKDWPLIILILQVFSKLYKPEIFGGLSNSAKNFFISKRKKKGKDQVPIQSSTTPDPEYQWKSDNFTIRHHKREPRGQLFPSR